MRKTVRPTELPTQETVATNLLDHSRRLNQKPVLVRHDAYLKTFPYGNQISDPLA